MMIINLGLKVGYGLEGALNDAKTGRIQDDYLMGNFKAGDYDEGIKGTYLKLAEEVFKEYDIDATSLVNQNVYYYPSINNLKDFDFNDSEIVKNRF